MTTKAPKLKDSRPPKDPIEYVDWLRHHMRVNLRENLSRPRVWVFQLRPRNPVQMLEMGGQLEIDGYMVEMQESLHETHISADGKRRDVIGPPQLTLFLKGVFSSVQLKARLRQILKIAKANGAKYDGLDAMSVSEHKMIFGPPQLISFKDAAWRLRSYTDTGLKAGSKMPFRFGFKTKRPATLVASLTKALKPMVDKKQARVQEAGPFATWQVEVVVLGKNDEKTLKDAFTTMEGAAKQARVKLKGVLL